jgi:mono/diheme cytochrome c family protein
MTAHRGRHLWGATLALAISHGALAAEPTDAQKGNAVFQKWCAPCHGSGVGKPGTIALQALYKGTKPALLEKRTDLTPKIVKTFVRHGVSVMPFFRKTEISDADLDALATYLARKPD